MVFKVINSELAELFVGETLITLRAGVVEKESSQLYFEPGWSIPILIQFNYDLSNSGGNDACILLPTQVHGLVFELREFLVEFLYGQVVKLSNRIITIGLIRSFRETYFSRALDEEYISLFVPVEGIDSEVFGASDEDKGALGVEGAVES